MSELILNQTQRDQKNIIFGGEQEGDVVKLPETISECSICLSSLGNNHCSSPEALNIMTKIISAKEDSGGEDSPAINVSNKNIIDKTKRSLNCDSERCIIESSKFNEIAGDKFVEKELALRYKILGPTNTALLSNFNIDKSLIQWAYYNPDFYPYNFNMVDYESAGDTLATIDVKQLYESGYRYFACIINSDKYSGRGKHWMALFGDMRSDPWTVEFFNSSGNAPVQAWIKWLVKTRDRFQDIINEYKAKQIPISRSKISIPLPIKPPEIIKVSDFRHQKSRTECGVYSLYYIWARINKLSHAQFKVKPIPDSVMFEFRQHLFKDLKRPEMEKFDYEKYKSMTIIKWE